MRSRLAAISAALVATGAIAAPQFVPTGAKIEASGFATIDKVPGAPYPDVPPPAENRPQGESEWYARDQGISIEEARKRRAEQQAIHTEFELLLANLRSREAENFTAPRLVHNRTGGTNSTSSAIPNGRLPNIRTTLASLPGWRVSLGRSWRR